MFLVSFIVDLKFTHIYKYDNESSYKTRIERYKNHTKHFLSQLRETLHIFRQQIGNLAEILIF